MQIQISSWRKELSIIVETGTVPDNGKLSRKKIRVTDDREVAQLTETLKEKVQEKANKNYNV